MKFVRILIALILSVSFLFAQETEYKERPKIGLTLSGGGARGIAHIGVLKVLEEEGIKVDFITGTSMGSIVGGLYAIGYSASELEKIMLEQNWDEILLDEISLRSISMEEKDAISRYIGSFPIEEGKVNLPVGLVAGQMVHSLISKLCISVHHIEEFSNLPIPFLCIATDIETGEIIVLKDGFLPDAIRASMSIPSVFAPIEINGQLLVDGGLVKNFPVSNVIEMGADIIIGVDVGVPLYNKKKLNSLVKIMNQAISFQGMESTIQERKLCDVLIEPAVDDFSIMDFEKAKELIALGEEAGRKMLPQIRQLKETISQFPGKTEIIPLTDIKSLYIKKIHVQGLRKVSKNLVLGKLGISKNKWIKTEELQQAVERIYGSQYFEKVTYKLEPNENGVDLFIRVVEKSTSTLNFGLHYDNDVDSSVLINTTFRNKFIMGSKLMVEAELGNNKAFEFSYFIHTGWKPGFGFGLAFERLEYEVTKYNQGRIKVANFDHNANNSSFDIQTIFSNSITIGGGVQLRSSKIIPEILQSNYMATKLDYTHMIFRAYCDVNTLDRTNYPRKGVKILADARRIIELQHSLVDEGFLDEVADPMDSFSFKMAVIDRVAGNLYYDETFQCGSLVNSDSLQYDSFFYLGGMNEPEINLIPFAGYRFMSLSAANFMLLSSSLYYEIKDGIFAKVTGNWAKLGSNVDDLFMKNQNYFGWAVTAGWLTPIGPLEISYTGGDEKNDNYYYVNIGYYF
jgi:NTE family protein